MTARLVTVVAVLFVCTPGFAQWAVFDIANLQQNVANYAAMVEQIAKEGEQIANQVRQIQQMEDRLKRMGNMADVKAVVGFPDLRLDLNLPTRIKIWASKSANGRGIFGDARGGAYTAIAAEFPDFDGSSIERASEPFVAAEQIVAKVDEFKEVQADVYARREQLRKAITQTSESLQAAETEAEEKKLEAILNAQYSQLAALDSEVALSAAEIQVRVAESTVMSNAQTRADAEARGKLAQREADRIRNTFQPIYGCLLQQVREKPMTP
jgi:type IV secretion system protein TrbJ